MEFRMLLLLCTIVVRTAMVESSSSVRHSIDAAIYGLLHQLWCVLSGLSSCKAIHSDPRFKRTL